MEPHDVVDLGRRAIMIMLEISAPMLIVGMVVGLLIGLAQALTQVQEQTVAFVPKVVVMILALSFSLPWAMSRMMEYTRELIQTIPDRLWRARCSVPMEWLAPLNVNQFVIFTLVLTRVSGLAMTAPVYGTNDVPIQVRALLAAALAMLITPGQLNVSLAPPANVIDYGLLCAAELAVGLTLGYGIQILFTAVQLAGQLLSQMSGMSLADVFNPSLENDIPLLSQLLHMFALALFVIVGGHRLVMAGLLDTFAMLPPGVAEMPLGAGETFNRLLTQSLELGVRAAAPATAALLVATVVMGIISRTVPQLNVMALGFGVNAAALLLTLALSLGGVAWAFQEQIEPFIEQLLAMHAG